MIISVINLKGGVGKTTTAVALATAAARDGLSARVLDTDPQSSASLWALTAEESDDPLPFAVESANIATVRMAGKKYRGDGSQWLFIDCPPSGNVMDEAMKAADLVVVPTTPSPADLAKTFETTATLSERGAAYAVLLARVSKGTLTLRGAMSDLAERDESYFETQIPARQAMSSFFGNAFGDDLFGYEKVWDEVKEVLKDAG